MESQTKGFNGEVRTMSWLRAQGLEVSSAGYYSPFDLVVNGWRCEVKTADLQEKTGTWRFNIHRHGKTDESKVDFYILVMRGVPYSRANIYLVKKAPLGVPTMGISVRSLIARHSHNINDVSCLKESIGPLPLKSERAAVSA